MNKKKNKKDNNQVSKIDPKIVDKLLRDRKINKLTRRGFLIKGSFGAICTVFGINIVFANKMPYGLLPVAFTEYDESLKILGKHSDLTILNDKPWNVETPPHLLDDEITPTDKFFIRNNGIPPKNINIKNWTLTIEGESIKQKKVYTLQDLKSNFKHYTYQLVLECGGNGRHEFNPPAKGNQWTLGAIGCSKWTGVRLKDVLESAGIKSDSVYIGYYGRDVHLSGDTGKVVISRGVPMSKALENESLIAWSMNGKEIPLMNGYPLRLVFGGWPASTSGKWLHKIVVRNKIHDGAKMGGYSYRVPCVPIVPGYKVREEEMCIIESMPVKSLITYPKTGAMIKKGQTLTLRGHAWAGDLEVSNVHVSIDFGATWEKCDLISPINRFAWQHWNSVVHFPKKGYYEVWARATDTKGNMQPMVVPNWNPKGYLNNACHRIAIKVI